MAQDQPDWTLSAQLNGGTVDIARVTTVEQVTTIAGAKTVEVVNKATTVIQTGDRFDILAAVTGRETTPSGSAVIPINAGTLHSSYAAIMVTTNLDFSCVLARCRLTPGERVINFSAPFGIGMFATYLQAVVPVAVQQSGGITVTLFGGPASTLGNYRVYGLTSNPGVRLRADGRAYPIGRRTVGLGSATQGATQVFIPAPPTPMLIMLNSFTITIGSTTGFHFGQLNGVVADVVTPLVMWQVSGSMVKVLSGDFPGGFANQSGESIRFTLAQSGQNMQAVCRYTLMV